MLNKLLALIILICITPIFIIVVLLISIDDGFLVFFTKKRVGKNYTFFKIYKFRSFKKNTSNTTTLLLEILKQYILKVGKALRKLCLDEGSNLINILFISPKPTLYNHYDLMALRVNRNIDKLKPELTG